MVVRANMNNMERRMGMEALFVYFLTIGAGLTVGVGIVVVPAWFIFSKFKSNKKSY